MSTILPCHPLTGPAAATTVSQALDVLRPSLPTALPLYRRLQFGRFFEASRLVTNLTSLDVAPTEHEPYLLAFVDRTSRPETEVFLYCSWEGESAACDSSLETSRDALILSLAATIKGFGIPTSIHQDLLDAEAAKLQEPSALVKDSAGISRMDYAGHLLNPNIMLCGAIHETVVPSFQRVGLVSPLYEKTLIPNHTYVFDVDSLPTPRTLPAGLRWGALRDRDYALVISRTQIPRQQKTLAALPSQAIIDERSDEPVSWAFIGLDGSLTSLHVEPELRGRGLAKAVAVKLFTEQMGRFWEEGTRRYAHAYVIVGNHASCRVCESLAGKSDWRTIWVRMDLGAVHT